MPILEAQAAGLPVIISDNGIIPNEVKKYCISEQSEEDMASRFLDIYENGYDIKEAKRAFDYAHSFTWKKAAEKVLMVYEDTINK